MDNEIEERKYLAETMAFLKKELAEKIEFLRGRRKDLKDLNKEMYEETAHHNIDQIENNELALYLGVYAQLAHAADIAGNQVKKYGKMLNSPYFGRFDFREDGYDDIEKIYIGYYNLMNAAGTRIFVLDWRAPVSSVYYRYELGKAAYEANGSRIEGEVSLKRQFKIENGELKFFFDSGVVISDEILREALSRNTTGKMKAIAETLQKEQDGIIRDTVSDVVSVQGVAGSGKTNIALHRAAYLLYEGRKAGLSAKNIIIISPNSVFSDYIDEVLPSLGEDAANETTMSQILRRNLPGKRIQSKNNYLEQIIKEEAVGKDFAEQSAAFKSSAVFCELLDRYADVYLRKGHVFQDIVFDGEVVLTAQRLKNLFLDNKIKLSAESSLRRMYARSAKIINEHTPDLYKKVREIVENNPKLRFEEEANTRRIVAGIRRGVLKRLRAQFSMDFFKIYRELVSDEKLFARLAAGLELPDNAGAMLKAAGKSLDKGKITYGDASAMLYLKLKLSSNKRFGHIRHVIIDEAQDYGVLHYKCFRMLYPNAKFMALGDINQSVGSRAADLGDTLGAAFSGKAISSMKLEKCYRSTHEITEYANRLLGLGIASVFRRHAEKPVETPAASLDEAAEKIKAAAAAFAEQKLHTVAIITKTISSARRLFAKLNDEKICFWNAKNPPQLFEKGGVCVLPVYMAKGLEFDAVIVYGPDFASESPVMKNLMYIACTRALHRLEVIVQP